MKKGMVKLISLALVMMLTIAMLSVGAFAYSDEYATITMPENYEEELYTDMEESGYINIYYYETSIIEGKEYYTYNTVDLYVEVPGMFTSGELEDYFNDETLELVESFAYGEVQSSEYYYTEFAGEKAVALDVYYKMSETDEDGAITRLNCLLSEVVCIKDGYVITADIDIASGAEDLIAERDRILADVGSSLTLDAEKVEAAGGTFDKIMGMSIGIVIVVFIVILLIPIGIIVLIVVLVRSSKKKKAMRAQQQNAPYGYNPYGVPQQPYGNGAPQQPYGQPQVPSYMKPPVDVQQPVEAPAEENVENGSKNLDN